MVQTRSLRVGSLVTTLARGTSIGATVIIVGEQTEVSSLRSRAIALSRVYVQEPSKGWRIVDEHAVPKTLSSPELDAGSYQPPHFAGSAYATIPVGPAGVAPPRSTGPAAVSRMFSITTYSK